MTLHRIMDEKAMLKDKLARHAPWAGLALSLAACHLVIDLGKEQLPLKDGSSTECTTTVDCDDGEACTEDHCELPAGLCTHFLRAAGWACRPAVAACDAVEACNGTDPGCPPDEKEPATTICRESVDPGGTCDPPEYCPGDSDDCPGDIVENEGEPCNDGDDCTYDDTCDGLGGCVGTNGLAGVTYLSAAGQGTHTCTVLSNGLEASCWGSGSFYQLGNGTAESSTSAVLVAGLPLYDEVTLLPIDEVLQVSGGGYHTCALLHSGRIFCWGRNDFGQLGIGSVVEAREPQEVLLAGSYPDWDFVSAGYYHTCAIHRHGGLACWGANDRGQLGNGTTEGQLEPTVVTGLSSRATRVSTGRSHTCAVLDDGDVQCWGDDASGQIGNDTVTGGYTDVPMDVVGLSGEALAVSLGFLHSCALLSGGEVMCWGDNTEGQLGIGTTGTGGSTPVAVTLTAAASTKAAPSASNLSSGENHTCVLLVDGRIDCWGAGDSGQLGNGTGDNQPLPVDVTGLAAGATAVSCGLAHSCALFETGTVHCWGDNGAGQLGNGTNDGSLIPVQVLCR
jgi:alpha-tubulin suppressor-like RCC1 family protein